MKQVDAGPSSLVEDIGLRCGEQPHAVSNAPASRPAWAAANARSVRRAGSRVSSTERCKKAAAAAIPPRAAARSADCSSSTATDSSVSTAAAARCHARRSGSTCASVAAASAACTARRSSALAAWYTADRTSGWRNVMCVCTESKPSVPAATAAAGVTPSRAAARHTSAGSPTGSAAATSSSSRESADDAVASGSFARCARATRQPAAGRARPPAGSRTR